MDQQDQDEGEVIEKSFLKMKVNMEKDGYREGIEEGRQQVFQKSFDQGYIDGFQNGYILGKLKGAAWGKFIFDKMVCSHETLNKSSRGACVLCKDEKFLSQPLDDIKTNQAEVLKALIKNMETSVK
ncbi:hypothetical protein HHI36_000350 [Cryptolaemus montrouzieri]